MSSVHDVADFFINLASADQDNLTPLKLQKLCYYAQGWHLALHAKPLFAEPLEAWVHGPVVQVLYDRFKHVRHNSISPRLRKNPSPSFPKPATKVLTHVWQTYGGYSAKYLERLTHQEDPWRKTRAGRPEAERCNDEITHTNMNTYFKAISSVLTGRVDLERLEVICELYSQGVLEISEVASALHLDSFEVPFLLESMNCTRDVSQTMSEDDFQEKLNRIRADRLERNGKPAPALDMAVRDVVSSQRLEGMDAREWARRKLNSIRG